MIDEKRLANLVSDKSGMSREQVEEQLNKLAKNVQKASETGETFKIQGFGTFKKEKETTLFEPDEILQTEVNQKYAGMKPIELMGSFKETGTGIPAEVAAVSGALEHQTLPDLTPEEPVEPPVEANDTETEIKAKVENAEEVEERQAVPSRQKEEGKADETTADDETGLAGIIIVAAAIIIAILLAGWLFYTLGVFGKDKAVSDSPVATSALPDNITHINGQQNRALNPTSPGLAKVSILANEANKSNSNFNDINESVSIYGLKGTINPEATDGYTIIVHSLRRKEHAFETLASLKEQGYRSLMLQSNVSGVAQWRLGIGQFKTIADAQKTAKTLPEPFRSNHFIKHQ